MSDEKKSLLDAIEDMEKRGKELGQKKKLTEDRIKKHVPPLPKEKSRSEKVVEKVKDSNQKSTFNARNNWAILISLVLIGVCIFWYLNREQRMDFILGLIFGLAALIKLLVKKGKL